MNRIVLTDKKLKSLKSAPEGTRQELWDAIVPGLGVRVTDRGAKSFVFLGRFPGGDKKNPDARRPTRRKIGEYGAISLERAREHAREWHGLLSKGIDPKEELERQQAAEREKRNTTFAKVAEDFIKEKLPGERTARETERDIRSVLIPVWGRKAVTEVTDIDVLAVIKEKKKTAPLGARNLLADIKRLFTWAVDQRVYGLKRSPAADLKPSKVIGKKRSRKRTLSDDELFALWRATDRLGYPHGTVYKFLILAALRLNEPADASWPEFNLHTREWLIPKERMKARPGEEWPHMVPITDDLMALLQSLPRFTGEGAGPFLFTTTNGQKPIWMTSKIKAEVDARMLRTLKALARIRGDDPKNVTLPHWVNHDIRRTFRSNTGRLKIPGEVAESILHHKKKGMEEVYDVYEYFDEKREALEIWAAKLKSLLEPPPANVVTLKERA